MRGVSAAERTGSSSKASTKARIVIAEDSKATEAFTPRIEVVRKMVSRGIAQLTLKRDAAAAWRSLVATNDVVGIKVYSAPGATSGTRPEVVAAVVEGLLASGIKPTNVIVWDKHLSDLAPAGFTAFAQRYGIRVAGAADAGWDEKVSYDRALIGQLVFGDLEFGQKGEGVGRKSFVSRLVTKQITKIINITPLLNHNLLGVCGNLQSLAFGSVDNTIRFEHNLGHLFEAVPELYNLPELGDRVVLNITDALICQHEGEQTTLLHYSTVLNQLRFSTDPVALDVTSIEELQRQRKRAGVLQPKVSLEMFRNATELQLGESEPRNIRVEWAK
ncbi:MAG: DUF362 domain-containing protein [Verrucomicrobia bacterium]|nr:DUF362 domain-containing protein [Verrucomicrobiota bacterium]